MVTHGDLASHNLIEDEQGRLFLIDWSKLCLAPAARDLVALWEDGNVPLLAAYRAAAGSSFTLSKQAVTYYLCTNLLAIITDYGSWLLLEDASQEEAEHAWKQLAQALPIGLEQVDAEAEAICTAASTHTR
jgi:thiamine kinase-like enzyme